MFGYTLVKIKEFAANAAILARLSAESRFRDAEIARLTDDNGRLQHQNALLRADIEGWRRTELDLHKATTAARTMTDLLRVEVNMLREKEAALLAQLLPTLRMAVPRVETDEGLLAGVGMFDDMGDRNAARDSLSDFVPDPRQGDRKLDDVFASTPQTPTPEPAHAPQFSKEA